MHIVKNWIGSGFINVNGLNNTDFSSEMKKSIFKVPKDLDTLTKAEIEEIAVKLINLLDLKSKKQMQILNSIPINTNTFRRDYGSKFNELELIESEKQHLRNELLRVDHEIVLKKYKSNFKFKHFLSDKNLDVTSNR